ncbi:MAG TPA: hypothetical protein VGQ80_00700 [Acidimicrobiia bacterium]|nr:hypothetical protein [Acidimicrobiia bacterium]
MAISSRRAVVRGSADGGLEAATAPVSTAAPRRGVPLSVVVVLVPALVAFARLLIGLHRPFTHYGDDAILEAAVRRVAAGTQTLGPYSRFGFHQPGPAYFFLQAPFWWLTGGSPRALFLGATAINLGSVLGCVLVVRRWCGEPAARWTAVVVSAYVLAVTPALVTDPWNPYVLGLPLLAGILLAAGAATGSVVAAGGAAVIGSYLVQTHVATALTVAAVSVVAAGGFLVGRRAPGRAVPRRRPWAALAAIGGLLALLWMPPVIEQFTHSPGNLTRLSRFFFHAHPEYDRGVDHGLHTATRQVAAELATLPFGRAPAGGRGWSSGMRDAVAGAGLLTAAGVAAIGCVRRRPFVAVLGGASLTGTLAALWSTTRIVGEVLPYLLLWSSVLLLPAWIGVALVVPRPRMPARWPKPVSGAGAVVLAVVLAWSMLRAPLPPLPDNPDVAAAAGLTRPWLEAQGIRRLRIRLGVQDQWPLAAGVIDRLDRQGLAVSVDPEWMPVFGDQFKPTRREAAEVWITDPAATPPVAGRQRLGVTAGASLWAGLRPGGGQP